MPSCVFNGVGTGGTSPTSHWAHAPKISSKKASDVGGNASDEWLQSPDHSWVQFPPKSAGENASDIGSNSPDAWRMI